MLSISTAWNYREDMNALQMLIELKATGLKFLELGYHLRRHQLEELIPLLEPMNFKISSIHNYCPVPDDGHSSRHISNYYRLSALEETERQRAVKWTCNSIDTAVRVGAGVVVIHAGTVELEERQLKQLFDLYQGGKKETKEFIQLRDELLRKRREECSVYLEALQKSLDEVMSYTQKKKMRIGLETRYYINEIPNWEEVGLLLTRYHHQGMFYWHDVGHAEVNERFGISPHLGYLKHYANLMIGWHLHGVKILRDHQAPLEGDFDLMKVLPFSKKDHIKVIESHSMATLEQIRKAVKILSSFEEKT